MTTDNVPSTRGLQEGADLGPLRKFTGIFDSMPIEKQTFTDPNDSTKKREGTKVNLNYKDIEVLQSLEPYALPIVTLGISLSNKKKSRWGMYSTSFNTVVDSQYSAAQLDPKNPMFIQAKDRMALSQCFGKRMGLVVVDGIDGRPQPPLLFNGMEKKDIPTPCWTVYSVEGIVVASGGSSNTPYDIAVRLLDGKTVNDFNKVAFESADIRGDAQLLQSIGLPVSAPTSFTNVLLTAKMFIKDNSGVFHKV